jgi:Undecaprenyl-phosphate glucose phosphotransferase
MTLAKQHTVVEPYREETRGRVVVLRPSHPETAPPPEAPADRRGPMRPTGLAPVRQRMSPWTVRVLLRLGDLAGLVAAIGAALLFSAWRLPAEAVLADLPRFLIAAALLAWSLGAIDVYRLGRRESLARHLVRLTAACGLGGGVVFFVAYAFGPGGIAPELDAWFCLSVAGLTGLHALWWGLVRRWRRLGRLTPNIVVVGATTNAARLIERLTASGDAAVLGVFDDRLARAPRDVAGVPVLGDTNALIGHDIMPYVDRVVITVPSLARSRVSELVARLGALPNELMLFVDHDTEAGRAASMSRIADAPLARLSQASTDERRALVKRIADLVIGSAALTLCLPIMAVVAIAIRLDSPGPIFFRQRRAGFNNEPFTVYKFRSMRAADADETDRCERQVCVDDERVTRVGRFIRRSSLDELPQIFNVLAGQMSLVGPRPHAIGMRTGEMESARLVAGYAHRHRIKPGVTGWAAVNGSRGPVDTVEGLRRRVALDIEYIERQSFWFDLAIMAMTIPCLLGDRKAVR